jgi:hypothetical protein
MFAAAIFVRVKWTRFLRWRGVLPSLFSTVTPDNVLGLKTS